MAFRLGDDGTLDTVVVCEDCGQELRYSYDYVEFGDYDTFVDWAIEDAESDHICGEDE